MSERLGLNLPIDYDIDTTIKQHIQKLRKGFSVRWADHKCGDAGCWHTIIGDGDMKPHREVFE